MPKRTGRIEPASHARYWSHKYTANYLGVSETTLKRHVQQGLFPSAVPIAIGRKVYLADEVKRWCDQRDARRAERLTRSEPREQRFPLQSTADPI